MEAFSDGDKFGLTSRVTLLAAAPILHRHAPQQTEKIRREIQNPQFFTSQLK
jgi:hypothetical protein